MNEKIKQVLETEKQLNKLIKQAGLISMKDAVARRGATRQAIISLANSGTIEMFKIAGISYVFKKELDAHPPKGTK